MLLIVDRMINVRWHRDYRSWYIDKGYEYTNDGLSFKVDLDDLHDKCSSSIALGCDGDSCTSMLTMTLTQHRNSRAYKIYGLGSYFCRECRRTIKLGAGGFKNKKMENHYTYLKSKIERRIKLPDEDAIKFNLSIIQNRNFIPEISGIYKFFSKNNELLYIGKAKNLRSRICNHIDGISNTKDISGEFSYVSCFYVLDLDDLDEIETLAINELKPKYNLSKVYTYDSKRYDISS